MVRVMHVFEQCALQLKLVYAMHVVHVSEHCAWLLLWVL